MQPESLLSSPKIALIDGDILTYRLGFGGQKKLPDGTVEPIPDKVMKHRVDDFISNMLIFHLPAVEDYEGYLSLNSDDNYRHAIAVTAPYKGNRTEMAKPVHYELIREHLLTSWEFHGLIGQEADDSLAQEQTRLGDYSVICSIDKDMLQVPGWHWNFVKRKMRYVNESEGFYSFCIQLLTGDRTDNIVGIRGIGPAKAAKCLSQASTSREQLRAVSEVYRQSGDGLLRHFRENCGLLWLRRRTDGAPELIDELLKEFQ